MQYFGGKVRISKNLALFINNQLKENQTFVDLFCGSCNVISKIDNNRLRIANDKHYYLIEMWKELQKGWLPPKSLTKEEYKYIKNNKDEKPYLTAFVGFGCSFAGKWFGGYAHADKRNYCLNAYNSVLNKLKNLKNVMFYNLDYSEVDIPKGSFVYCDIPYKNTTPYCKKEVGEFNHEEFYQWVRENSNKYEIYVSEYKENVPNDFEIVWEQNSKKDIRNKNNIKEKTIEVLMKYNK
jgi:DNA adenine methylase